MNKLRAEAQALLSGIQADRPAAVRRCRHKEYLYATDLPLTAGKEAVAVFIRRAETAGWRTKREDGWILLDRIPEEPPQGGFQGPYGPEAKCCASLLRRHPEERRRSGETERRRLIKAGEESPEAYERTCKSLHREWAADLRQGTALPDLTMSFFEEEAEK